MQNNPTLHNNSVKESQTQFMALYKEYRRIRKNNSMRYPAPPQSRIESNTVRIRECIAQFFLLELQNSLNWDDFRIKVHDILRQSFSSEETLDTATVYPVSKSQHSPLHAIRATMEQLEILRRIHTDLSGHVDFALLSGSLAYGSFYSVKGKIPRTFTDLGIPQKLPEEMSDIDILCFYKNEAELNRLFHHMVERGLASRDILNRGQAFASLHSKGKADIFSHRSHLQGFEQSYHFLSFDFIHKSLSPHNLSLPCDISLNDFRATIPKNIRLYGSYPMYAVNSNEIYMPEKAIKEVDAGYISRVPICKIDHYDFYLGLYGWFFLIMPLVLLDEKRNQGTLFAQLEKLMRDFPVQNIIRQERMPSYFLSALRSKYGQNTTKQPAATDTAHVSCSQIDLRKVLS